MTSDKRVSLRVLYPYIIGSICSSLCPIVVGNNDLFRNGEDLELDLGSTDGNNVDGEQLAFHALLIPREGCPSRRRYHG